MNPRPRARYSRVMSTSSRPSRTLYQSRATQRTRRRSKAIAAALAVLLLSLAVAVVVVALERRDAEGAAAKPQAARTQSASPAAVPRLAALHAVRVHRGEKARFACRIDGPSGTAWAVTLRVDDPSGAQVKARRLGVARAGASRSWLVPVDLPAGRYVYRVEARGVDSGTDPTMPEAPSAALVVLPPLAPGFPGKKATAKALAWAGSRSGDVAVVVVDTNGELSGIREHATFQAASLAKAILLAAYLRSHPKPDAGLDTTATTMIEESDNPSAYRIYGVVGAKGMRAVAKLAGMQDYEQGAGWTDTRLSAADAAHFFHVYEACLPASRRAFARKLLAGITQMQRWGIPAAAGPAGWKTYHKSGWLGLDNRLMVQAAWLEKGKKRWALAVMTDDNPDRSYGWDTQKGVAGLLLGEEPTPAYLAPVLEY